MPDFSFNHWEPVPLPILNTSSLEHHHFLLGSPLLFSLWPSASILSILDTADRLTFEKPNLNLLLSCPASSPDSPLPPGYVHPPCQGRTVPLWPPPASSPSFIISCSFTFRPCSLSFSHTARGKGLFFTQNYSCFAERITVKVTSFPCVFSRVQARIV